MKHSLPILILACTVSLSCDDERSTPSVPPRGVISFDSYGSGNSTILDIQSDGAGRWCAFCSGWDGAPASGHSISYFAWISTRGEIVVRHPADTYIYPRPVFCFGSPPTVFMASYPVSERGYIKKLDSTGLTLTRWSVQSLVNASYVCDIQFIEPGVIGCLTESSSHTCYFTMDETGSLLDVSPSIRVVGWKYSSRAFNAHECVVFDGHDQVVKIDLKEKSTRVLPVPLHGDSSLYTFEYGALSACSDGSFYLLGQTSVCKMDTAGREIWFYRKIGNEYHSIRTTPDGGCIIGGARVERDSPFSTYYHVAGLVMRFSPDGALLWSWELPCDRGIDVKAVEYLETDEILVGGEAGCWLQRAEMTSGAWIAKLRARDGSLVESFGAAGASSKPVARN